MNKSPRTARRRYWVDTKFQAGLILRLFVVSIFATALAWAVFYNVWASMLECIDWSPGDPDPTELLRAANARVLATTLVLIPAFFVLAFIFGLIVSHRIAGPVHRLNRVLAAAAEGRLLEDAGLRREDSFQELCANVNKVLGRIRQERERVRGPLEAMRQELAEMHALTQATDMAPQAVRGHVQRLTEIAEECFANTEPNAEPDSGAGEDAEAPGPSANVIS